MNSNQWVKKYFFLSAFFLIIVVSVNFIIDPGYIYSKKNSHLNPAFYAEKLLSSTNGLIADGWDERKVKLSLAKNANDFDCVVIGSSRVFQISSERNTGNISENCSSIINLAVSGGSFEDMLTYSKVLLGKNKDIKRVFIEVSPWFFKFNMEVKSALYKDYYGSLLVKLDKDNSVKVINYKEKLIFNLFNLDYFISSLKKLSSFSLNNKIIEPTKSYDIDSGYDKSLFLKDGSYVYNNKFLLDAKEKINKIKLGGGEYKIEGEIYDIAVVKVFIKLINIYRENNIEPAIILTPYHPNVFKEKNSKPYKHILNIEQLSHKLALNNNLEVFGSFFPQKLGCREDEFLDYMHATKSCLDKINFKGK